MLWGEGASAWFGLRHLLDSISVMTRIRYCFGGESINKRFTVNSYSEVNDFLNENSVSGGN